MSFWLQYSWFFRVACRMSQFRGLSMNMHHDNLFRLGILLISLLVSPLVLADRSDWVQVERFEKQLAQAQQGKVSAMYEIGRMYEYGRGTDYDLGKAAEWYQKAVTAGSAPAAARLGVLYLEGRGVRQDHKKAYKLFADAANEGVPLAQYNLGLLYEWGTVVSQNRDKALFWYQKALKGGDYRASHKIKQLKTRKQNSLAQKPAPATPVKTAKTAPATSRPKQTGSPVLTAILSAKWMQGTHPAGYLPSEISQCEKISAKQARCTSKQQRNTDAEIIIYDTDARLENFRGNRFTITYTNTVVDVKPRETSVGPLGEGDTAPVTSNIKVGQKSRPHTLDCQLLDESSLRCTRDNIRTYDFTS